jgi:hypothetical protein
MMIKKLYAYYLVFLGVSIFGMWIIILLNGEIEEGRVEFIFHLCSEFLMALFCFSAGILALTKHFSATGLSIAGHAMLVYSVLNAAGYYAERGYVIFPVLFIILFLLSMFFIYYLIKK